MVELINSTQVKAEHLKVASVLFHKKLHAAYIYKPSAIYNGNVLLIKAEDNFFPLKHDYGVSEVIIYYIEC